MEFPHLGKLLMAIGAFFLLLGGLIVLAGKIPWLGRLPGDISIKRENFQFYFPITTCILLSALLTLLFWLLRRGK
jgi:hypothetical protein